MTELIVAIAVLFSSFILVMLYGKSQRKVGGLESDNKQISDTEKREMEAKTIESKPVPNSPDDVADAWGRMQNNNQNKS